jgi:hypothetical protein
MKPFRSSLLLLLGLLIFSACNSDDRPSHVLTKEKMVDILTNLHLAEAYVNTNFPFSDSSKYVYKKMQDSILKAQGTDGVAYDSSLAYYQRHVEVLDQIYSSVVDSLSLGETITVEK